MQTEMSCTGKIVNAGEAEIAILLPTQRSESVDKVSSDQPEHYRIVDPTTSDALALATPLLPNGK